MPVIGIDFGNDSCYIAAAKSGGIETIANDYDLRSTPSCVAFLQRNRLLGVAAKNQMVMNLMNTVFGFKRLLGRKFSDPHVERELNYLPFKVEPTRDGGVGIRVHYRGEDNVYSPEQVTAMLFTKLKESATAALGAIDSCVISVPSYFTDAERVALLDAATIAGLNVLCLFNETTATALSYGYYKEDLPAPKEKPRNVVFVDMGHSSLQVAACAFNKGRLKVLGIATDANCGGRDIDMALADYFCQEFIHKMDIDARFNYRACLRLIAEAEKLKRQMSANNASLMLNIESFMQGMDVSSKIQRSQMEKVCSEIFKQIKHTLRAVMRNANLRPEDIYSVEIVGGSVRIPAVKDLIEQVFGKPASTTLNQDEAVSRGCALQGALLSTGLRGRQFAVVDLQPYDVSVSWDKQPGLVELFPAFHAAPSSKLLTFDRRESFTVTAYYSNTVPYPDTCIGQWHILGITPTAEGDTQKVKLKIRLNINGIITVEKEENSADDKNNLSRHKKEWRINAQTHGCSQTVLKNYIEVESKMQAADRREVNRADARNALEGHVYQLQRRLREQEARPGNSLERELDGINTWLDLEGEHQDEQVFNLKLLQLRKKGEDFFTTESFSIGVKRQMSGERPSSYGFSREYTRRNDAPSQNTFSKVGYFNNVQASTSNGNGNSQKDSQYYTDLRQLNRSLLDWMNEQVQKNPTCILSPCLKEYDNYLKQISDRKSNEKKKVSFA